MKSCFLHCFGCLGTLNGLKMADFDPHENYGRFKLFVDFMRKELFRNFHMIKHWSLQITEYTKKGFVKTNTFQQLYSLHSTTFQGAIIRVLMYRGPMVQSWINPACLKINPLFLFVYFCTSIQKLLSIQARFLKKYFQVYQEALGKCALNFKLTLGLSKPAFEQPPSKVYAKVGLKIVNYHILVPLPG